ncbi:MAG: CdaR family protein [Ignavibacteria bacterium]
MNKNFGIVIVSFLFALVLWLYLNLNQSFSLDLSIPVIINSSKTQALAEEIPNNIDVKIRGKGWDLLNILISQDLVYDLDISKMKKDSKIITEQFVNERLKLQTDITVIDINPDTIDINFDKVSEKKVPVRNNIIVNLRDGYSIIGDAKLNPDSVSIKGALYLLNKIKYIPTVTKVFNNVNSDISGTITLKDTLQNLLKIEKSSVDFYIKVQLSAEKNYEDIEVKILNVPEDKEVLLIPPKITISIRGGVEELTSISAGELIPNIEYKSIEEDTLGFVIPELVLPENTNLMKIEPQKLQYIIKKKQED